MQQLPLRVLMSRDGSDANHVVMQEIHGVLFEQPLVGDPVQIFLDNGELLRTSVVTHVKQSGEELVVETVNSLYRLKPDPAKSN